MEYRVTTPMIEGLEVRRLQQQLNQARSKAFAVVQQDSKAPGILYDKYYFQTIHHLDHVPDSWQFIREDGKFGPNTERAVKGLQKFLFITENGILGNYTYALLCKLLTVKTDYPSVMYGDGKPGKRPIDNRNVKLQEIEKVFNYWNSEVMTPTSGISFFIVQSFIVIYEHSNLTLHVNLNQIVKDLLLPEKSRSGKWFYLNNKNFYRHGYKGFRIWKMTSDFFSNVGQNLGLVGFAFETVDVAGNLFKGKAKVLDVTKWGVDGANTFFDFAFANVVTSRISIKQAITNIGNAVVKYRFAGRITSAVGGTATAGTCVVAIQCVGAFWTGWELGSWLENKFHVGEKAMNYLWDLFLGDLIGRFVEWQVNRVVVIKYPSDWTDEQIKEFQKKSRMN